MVGINSSLSLSYLLGLPVGLCGASHTGKIKLSKRYNLVSSDNLELTEDEDIDGTFLLYRNGFPILRVLPSSPSGKREVGIIYPNYNENRVFKGVCPYYIYIK